MSIEYQSRYRSRVSIEGIDHHLTVDAFGTHDLATELNSYLVPLYMFPLVEGRLQRTLKLIDNLVALYMQETIKYARTLISMVFFCNWCSAADSSFFSSSTVSSSLFFDSLCSCYNNEYVMIAFSGYTDKNPHDWQVLQHKHMLVYRKRSMPPCSELTKFTLTNYWAVINMGLVKFHSNPTTLNKSLLPLTSITYESMHTHSKGVHLC